MGKKNADSPKDRGRLKIRIKSLNAKDKKGSKNDSAGKSDRSKAAVSSRHSENQKPIVVNHVSQPREEVPEGLPSKFLNKGTFNTHDIMHAPVEKTARMIDDILSGRRLFTM